MILELDGSAMLRLVNGEPIVVGNHVVRQGDQTRVLDEVRDKPHGGGNRTNAVRSSRRNARAALTGRPRKTGVHWINAKFTPKSGVAGCGHPMKAGDPIAYDYDNKVPYCECCAPANTQGQKPQEANA